MQHLDHRLNRARESSWQRFGKRIIFYLPGMFTYDGLRGKYPAISITGNQCKLRCEHCQGRTLDGMISAGTSYSLLETCIRLAKKGSQGVLISGGCDEEGRLPWNDVVPAIGEVKRRTGLYISIHCGLIDVKTAQCLKESGVDEALVDVIGDDETYRRIYHLRSGVTRIEQTLAALQQAGLPVEHLWVAGGATRSPVWPQILADISGVPISLTQYAQWPALGAAILAGVGAGIFDTLEAGIAKFQKSPHQIVPDEAQSRAYDEIFAKYQEISRKLWF